MRETEYAKHVKVCVKEITKAAKQKSHKTSIIVIGDTLVDEWRFTHSNGVSQDADCVRRVVDDTRIGHGGASAVWRAASVLMTRDHEHKPVKILGINAPTPVEYAAWTAIRGRP